MFKEFIEYVNKFYGIGGIYAKSDYATIKQIQIATEMYINSTDENVTWGGGDSLDRERVGYILTDKMGVKLY